jgi:hypothetical protein
MLSLFETDVTVTVDVEPFDVTLLRLTLLLEVVQEKVPPAGLPVAVSIIELT